jgi:hypothetical protein
MRNYSEAAYFDGDHCQHVADYTERKRIAGRKAFAERMMARNRRNAND